MGLSPIKMKVDKNSDFEELDELIRRKNLTSFQILFFVFWAFLTSLVPIYAFHLILNTPIFSYAPIYAVVTLLSTFFLSSAHQTHSRYIKQKLVAEREPLTQESVAKLQGASTKRKAKNVEARKVSLISARGREACAFGVLYNTSLFFFAVLVCGLVVFSGFSALTTRIVAAETPKSEKKKKY